MPADQDYAESIMLSQRGTARMQARGTPQNKNPSAVAKRLLGLKKKNFITVVADPDRA
jgi:hypothetical protein